MYKNKIGEKARPKGKSAVGSSSIHCRHIEFQIGKETGSSPAYKRIRFPSLKTIMNFESILKTLRTVAKPGKLIYFRLTHPINTRVKDRITAVLSFAIAIYTLFDSAPYHGAGEVLFACIIAFVLAGVCVLVVSLCFPFLQKLLALFFIIPACIYDYCDDSLNHVERKKSASMGNGPKARVGIKYFIEREKRIKINHAKWIGPN